MVAVDCFPLSVSFSLSLSFFLLRRMKLPLAEELVPVMLPL